MCDLVSCANGGVCFANRADGYICLCPLGFRGALCEESESTLFSLFSHTYIKSRDLSCLQEEFCTSVKVQIKCLCGSFLLSACHRLSHRPFKVITEQLTVIQRKLFGMRIIISYIEAKRLIVCHRSSHTI